jgi:hypothetical protein
LPGLPCKDIGSPSTGERGIERDVIHVILRSQLFTHFP